MGRQTPVALIGAGLIGRSWALLFARSGHDIALYDTDTAALAAARSWIEARLLDGAAVEIRCCTEIADTVRGAGYIQESGPEKLDVKRAIYREIEAAMAPDALLGTSTSALEPDPLFEGMAFAGRALVVHPTNPPHVLPAVELAASQWTTPQTMQAVSDFMAACGQDPIVLKRVTPGFVVNRLQAALVDEALRLVDEGIAEPDDVDKAVRSALGLRWAFIGPFETMDLNARDGFEQYARVFGPVLSGLRTGQDKSGDPWSGSAPRRVVEARRAILPVEDVAARQEWRDRQIEALRLHKAQDLSGGLKS